MSSSQDEKVPRLAFSSADGGKSTQAEPGSELAAGVEGVVEADPEPHEAASPMSCKLARIEKTNPSPSQFIQLWRPRSFLCAIETPEGH